MVHRRLKKDDHKGVGEPLNEKNQWNSNGLVQRVRHWIVFHDNAQKSQSARLYQKLTDQTPLIFMAATQSNTFIPIQNLRPVVKNNIPEYLKFYCKYMGSNTYLVRLHNMLENQSLSYTFDQGVTFKEFTLTANQLKSFWDNTKMKWNQTSTGAETEYKVNQGDKDNTISILPQQIRTFLVTANPS